MKFKELEPVIYDDFEIVIPNKEIHEEYSSFYNDDTEYKRIFNEYGEYEVKKIKTLYDTDYIRIILKD